MMTGNEIKKELMAALEAMVPDVVIKAAFTGETKRKTERMICVDILKEKHVNSICSAELGIWLCTRRAEDSAALFEAICTAIDDIPCAVRSVSRDEMCYDGTLGCMVTPCRVEVEFSASGDRTEKMRFGDFVFDSLPEALEVKRRGSVQETADVSGKTRAVYTGGGRRSVTGKGVLFGADGAKRYAELEQCFGKTDSLFLSGMAPFSAILCMLAVTEPVTGGTVRFDFAFEEAHECGDTFAGRTYLAKAGESLWDYAHRTGVSVEKLVAANPQIVCINALKDGEVVYIP